MSENSVQDLIEKADDAYYNTGEPIMSDAEYDALRNSLDEDDDHVGAPVRGVKVPHTYPMLSLVKVHTAEEIARWASSFEGHATKIEVQPKIDGLAISVHYTPAGVRAYRRGNGVAGEEVTSVVKRMIEIGAMPSEAKIADFGFPYLEVRGEVVISRTDFEKYKAQVDPGAAVARNLAAGIINRIDGSDAQYLSFFPYDAIDHGTGEWHPDLVWTLHDHLFWRESSLFVETNEVQGFQDVVEKAEKEWINNPDFPFVCDGVVLKVEDADLRKAMGSTSHHPLWAVAYKYANELVTTAVTGISWQVSANGRCIPVLEFEPVVLGDAKISRCTMNNYAYLLESGVEIGDIVNITLANGVIPKFEGVVVMKNEDLQGESWLDSMPEGEIVGRNLVIQQDHLTVPAVMRSLRGFGDIPLGMGPNIVRQIIEGNPEAHDFMDLVLLHDEKIDVSISGTANTRLAIKVFQEIAKVTDFRQWFVALGIQGCGFRIADKLVAHGIDSFWAILELAESDSLRNTITTIPGLGNSVANAIIENLDRIQKWDSEYAEFTGQAIHTEYVEADDDEEPESEGPLSGRIVCITGAIPGHTRKSADEHAVSLGAEVTGSVKKGDAMLLVIGDKPGGSKMTAAEKYGTETMTADEFLSL